YDSVFGNADWLFDHHRRNAFCLMEKHPASAFHTATDCGRTGHGMDEKRPGEGSPACRRQPHVAVVVFAALPHRNECFYLGYEGGFADGQDSNDRAGGPDCSRHLLAEPTGVAQTMASAATGIGSAPQFRSTGLAT